MHKPQNMKGRGPFFSTEQQLALPNNPQLLMLPRQAALTQEAGCLSQLTQHKPEHKLDQRYIQLNRATKLNYFSFHSWHFNLSLTSVNSTAISI